MPPLRMISLAYYVSIISFLSTKQKKMPPMPRESMSWLSPKRRRTTGNLKTLRNGQNGTTENSEMAPSSAGYSTSASQRRPSSPTQTRSHSQSGTARLVSEPMDGSEVLNPDDNLFYAYARRVSQFNSNTLPPFAWLRWCTATGRQQSVALSPYFCLC